MTFEEYKAFRLKGLDPSEAYNSQNELDTGLESEDEGFSAGKTIKNIPTSAGRFLGGVAGAVTHPIQTGKALLGLGAGAVEKLIPGRQAEEKYVDSLADFYKERYGGLDKTLETIENDPVGFAADISTVLTGGGAIASKIGTVSKVGQLSKVGATAQRLGQVANPLSAVTKVGTPLKNWMPKIATAIEKNNFRLTKVKEGSLLTKASKEGIEGAELITKNVLNDVADFMSNQKIVGSPTQRYAKATQLYNQTEDVLENFFNAMSKGSGVKKAQWIKSLQGLKGVYKGTRDSEAIRKQIDGAINTIKKDFSEVEIIPFGKVNKFKRTTMENAFNEAGSKVLNDIEYAIGNTTKGLIDGGLRGLKIAGKSFEEFNHNYGLLIQGRKILREAVGKRQLSAVTERLLGGLIGYALGNAGGAMAGAGGALGGAALGSQIFEQLPITYLKSATGAALQTVGKAKLPAQAQRVADVTPSALTAVERLTEQR